MMLRAFLVSSNATVAKRWLVPVASQTLLFFQEHWKDAKFFLEDSQALETYSHCDQPSCPLAGMRQLLRGLLLPEVKVLFKSATLELFEAMQANHDIRAPSPPPPPRPKALILILNNC